jgi:hypothetical protein
MVEPKEVDAIHVGVQVRVEGFELRRGDPPFEGRGSIDRNEMFGVAEGVGYKSGRLATHFPQELSAALTHACRLMTARARLAQMICEVEAKSLDYRAGGARSRVGQPQSNESPLSGGGACIRRRHNG